MTLTAWMCIGVILLCAEMLLRPKKWSREWSEAKADHSEFLLIICTLIAVAFWPVPLVMNLIGWTMEGIDRFRGRK